MAKQTYEIQNKIAVKRRICSSLPLSDSRLTRFVVRILELLDQIPHRAALSHFGQELPQHLILDEIAKILRLHYSGAFEDFEFDSGLSPAALSPLVWVVLTGGLYTKSESAVRDITANTKMRFKKHDNRRRVEDALLKASLALKSKDGWTKGRGAKKGIHYDKSRLMIIAASLERVIGERLQKLEKLQDTSTNFTKIKSRHPALDTETKRFAIYADIINWRVSLDLPTEFPKERTPKFSGNDVAKWIKSKSK